MGQITVTINERSFELACDEGQEDHLHDLVRYFARHVEELRGKFGTVGDSRLFIMAALTVADQLYEALSRVEDMQREIAIVRHTGDQVRGETKRIEDEAIRDIEDLAGRLEDLARNLTA